MVAAAMLQDPAPSIEILESRIQLEQNQAAAASNVSGNEERERQGRSGLKSRAPRPAPEMPYTRLRRAMRPRRSVGMDVLHNSERGHHGPSTTGNGEKEMQAPQQVHAVAGERATGVQGQHQDGDAAMPERLGMSQLVRPPEQRSEGTELR